MEAKTKSVRKVYAFLKENKQATPSEMVTKLNLHYDTIRASIELLKDMDKINAISNGKVTLIQIKN